MLRQQSTRKLRWGYKESFAWNTESACCRLFAMSPLHLCWEKLSICQNAYFEETFGHLPQCNYRFTYLKFEAGESSKTNCEERSRVYFENSLIGISSLRLHTWDEEIQPRFCKGYLWWKLCFADVTSVSRTRLLGIRPRSSTAQLS